MRISVPAAAQMLRDADKILILSHAKPDGDTLGSGFGLLFALEALGKTARLECSDPIPAKFDFLCPGYTPRDFEPEFVVAVDTADLRLLTRLGEEYADRIDLCLDHHASNTFFAKHTLLEADAAAAAEVIYHVMKALPVVPDQRMATALFTAITTDTGGLRFASVTPATLRTAADLIELGADHGEINRLMFETKSRGRIMAERRMLESMEFTFDGCCAVIIIPAGIKEELGVTEADLDGISSIPRTIEGVYAGLTLRGTDDPNSCRLSVRSQSPVDASAICAALGGGGHRNAAGATVSGSTMEEIKARILQEVRQELERHGIWKAS